MTVSIVSMRTHVPRCTSRMQSTPQLKCQITGSGRRPYIIVTQENELQIKVSLAFLELFQVSDDVLVKR